MKGSYFPSIRTTNLVQPILGSQYSIGNTVTALRESHQTIPSALRAETSSRVQFDPTENQNWHTNDSYLSQKEKAIFFLCRSSFRSEFSIARITRVLAIRALCIYISHETLGQASEACYQSTLISGMSLFSQWHFPLSGRSTNENLWEIVANSPFLGPSRLCHSLVHSRAACFARPNRRACSQAKIDCEWNATL